MMDGWVSHFAVVDSNKMLTIHASFLHPFVEGTDHGAHIADY